MKIILFGANGMLGNYVYNVLKKTFTVYKITRKEFDIENDSWNTLENMIKNTINQGDIIINCAGIIPQKYNNEDYKAYIRVNSLFPHKLNEYSLRYDYRFIHITTDCVYSGMKGSYTINDEKDAKTLYGISKSLGEPEEATVIRTSIIGEEIYGKKSLLEWVLQNKGNTIQGFTKHLWNGVTCFTLATILTQMISQKIFWRGTRHIFSPTPVSKYDLCKYISDIYDLQCHLVPNEESSKDMTLSGEVFVEIPEIYQQIKEQKEYGLY